MEHKAGLTLVGMQLKFVYPAGPPVYPPTSTQRTRFAFSAKLNPTSETVFFLGYAKPFTTPKE